MHDRLPQFSPHLPGLPGRLRFSPPTAGVDLLGARLGTALVRIEYVAPPAFSLDKETGELVPVVAPALAVSEGEGSASLGTTTKLSTPPAKAFGLCKAVLKAKQALTYPVDAKHSRIERYALLAAAREILPNSRTAHCCRSLTAGAQDVPVSYSESTKRAAFKNVQTCARVWRCPVCAARITERRRQELVRAVALHRESGGEVYLATRTFSHGPTDSVTDLIAGFSVAEKRYKSGASYKRVRTEFRMIGTIRSVEITYGANGWHPHIHELVFTRGPADIVAMQSALFERWHSACKRAGLGLPTREHGVDVRDGTYAAQYAAKWGMEAELTKWHVKKGKDSLSPFDFLRVVAQSDSDLAVRQAKALFSEYAEAFHGKRQLVSSPGLEHLKPVDEESDEEIAASIDPVSSILGILSIPGWRYVVAAGIRGQVLEAASTGSWPAVLSLLRKHWPAGSGPFDIFSLTVSVGSRDAVHSGAGTPGVPFKHDLNCYLSTTDRVFSKGVND